MVLFIPSYSGLNYIKRNINHLNSINNKLAHVKLTKKNKTKQHHQAMYGLAKLCRGYKNVIKYHEKDFDYQTNAKEPLTEKHKAPGFVI